MIARRRLPAAGWILVLAACLSPLSSAEACSVFCLSADDGAVCGKNLDWDDPLPALVAVNVRGVEKSILPWRGWWPDTTPREPVTWTSRHGSVTFTLYGRDFIAGGMNEAGLIVEEASLASVYPPDDGRPGVSGAQWMQYQLDNFATVDEVLEHLDDLRPDGEGMHHLIADSRGRCAVIEYLDGSPTVLRGGDLPVPAITNTACRKALDQLPLDKAFGGDADIAASDDSYGRFARMAAMMRDLRTGGGADPAADAFGILDAVTVADTRRGVVYDARSLRVSWRTAADPRVRRLDFADLDFTAGAPVLAVDVESGDPGDVSGELRVLTPELNRAQGDRLRPSGGDPRSAAELGSRGLTFAGALDMIARHPWPGR